VCGAAGGAVHPPRQRADNRMRFEDLDWAVVVWGAIFALVVLIGLATQ
jgi:hypothetical protein